MSDESDKRYGMIESMSEIVTARNTEDGTVGLYRKSFVEHPILGQYLEEVSFNSKPLVTLDTLVRETFDLPPREDVSEYVEPEEEED